MTRKIFRTLLLLAAVVLSACGGTLQVSFDVTPTPDPALTEALERIATLEPLFRPLDLSSSPEEIRRAMLNSHDSWQTLWVDARSVSYDDSGAVLTQRVQVWVDRINARFRVLSGEAEGAPADVQVSDGASREAVHLADGQVVTQALSDAARDPSWEAPQALSGAILPYPLDLEIDHPLSEMIFSTALAQREGSLTPTTLEKIAGRPALLVEFAPAAGAGVAERLWVDTRTGVVLRWQSWGKDPARQAPALEITVDALEYDAALPAQLFDLRLGALPQFALDAAGTTAALPPAPQATLTAGEPELFYVLYSPGAQPELQLARLPGSCVTGAQPCPEPQFVAGFPNQNNTIEPLVWSPAGDMAALAHQGTLYRAIPQLGEWQALASFASIRAIHWSPDGQWIAFLAQTADDRQEIYQVRPDGTDLQSLTGGAFADPQRWLWVDGWFYDGRVVYSEMQPTLLNLYARFPEEAQPLELSHMQIDRGLVALQPDGRGMAYSTMLDGGSEIWLAELSELGIQGQRARLASFQQASVQALVWSPDGQRLALQILTSAASGETANTVYVMRRDGTDLRQLYQGGALLNLQFAGESHLILEDADSGRAVVAPVDGGDPRALQIPGLRLDQQVRGLSWRP